MNRKQILIVLIFLIFNSIASKSDADVPPKELGENKCSIDLTEDDVSQDGTFRNRIEIYNFWEYCKFHLVFSFSDKTITLKTPIVLEKKLHDRGAGTLTGTWIDGFGTKGESLKIRVDAVEATKENNRCAFEIKGGFSAKQQIHGLTILAKSLSQAICDENQNDLLERVVLPQEDSICAGKKGKDCQFSEVTVLVPPAPVPQPDPTPTPKPDPTPTPTPAPKPDPAPAPKGDKSSTPDQSNLSDCQLAQVSHPFSLSAVLPMLIALIIAGSIRAKGILKVEK